MKKIFGSIIFVLAVLALVSPQPAYCDGQSQVTFQARDGGSVDHNMTWAGGFFTPQKSVRSVVHTPAQPERRVRMEEDFERTLTVPVTDPKCNNFLRYDKTTLKEKHKKNIITDQGSQVVHADSSTDPATVGLLFLGLGGAANSLVGMSTGGGNINVAGGSGGAVSSDIEFQPKINTTATATNTTKVNNNQGHGKKGGHCGHEDHGKKGHKCK